MLQRFALLPSFFVFHAVVFTLIYCDCGLGLDTCGLGLALVLGDKVLITSLTFA